MRGLGNGRALTGMTWTNTKFPELTLAAKLRVAAGSGPVPRPRQREHTRTAAS